MDGSTEVQMTKGTVLVVGSNATRIELQGGGSAAIGQYLNETVVPVMALIEAGYSVVLATPDGTKPHIDPVSDVAKHFGDDEAAHARARSFYADDPSMNQVQTLRSVIEGGLDGYAGLFVPGGHHARRPVAGEVYSEHRCGGLRAQRGRRPRADYRSESEFGSPDRSQAGRGTRSPASKRISTHMDGGAPDSYSAVLRPETSLLGQDYRRWGGCRRRLHSVLGAPLSA